VRPHSDALADVLTAGSFSRRLIADVFFGADRQEQDIDLTAWTIDYDLTAQVKMSGTATVVHQSVAGESWVPVGTEGLLSPFKAKLLLSVEISAGGFTETVTLGWARVTRIVSATDYWMDTPTGRVITASVIQLEFMSLDETVRRAGFHDPEQPPSLASNYAELRRIGLLPVQATVNDVAIPTTLTYPSGQGSRLGGVQDLFALFGGVGVVNTAGAWQLVPNAIGDPIADLVIGDEGTVTDAGYAVDTDQVYNAIVGTAEDANRNPLTYTAVAAGALAPNGLYGENTDYYKSDTAQTPDSLKAETEAFLANSIGGQTYQVPIQCIFSPLPELGDVLNVVGHTRPLVGRTLKLSLSDSALMNVTLEVARSF